MKNSTLILKCLLAVCLFMSAGGLSAQHKNKNPIDSVPRDTLDFYKKLRKSMYKHKSTKLLYQVVFVDPVHRTYEDKPLSDEQKNEDPNAAYVGKIIRGIKVTVYDPFGYSVNDTFRRNINGLQHFGNTLHVKTRPRILRHLLVFKSNDSVALFKITESERLLRQARYVNDARIHIVDLPGTDSVDVEVTVLDRWNFDGSITAGSNGGNIRIIDRNLGGLGQTFDQRIGYYLNSGYQFSGNYNISNIDNTYISSNIFYNTSKESTLVGVSFLRPFYSPLTRWAGGADFSRSWGKYKYTDTIEPFEKSLPLEYFSYDLWLAKSYAIISERHKMPTTNIVTAVRYADIRYLEKPSYQIDSNKIIVNTKIYLASIGFSFRKYYKDQYIYRFGANEDVPEGLLIQTTFGVINKRDVGERKYVGFEVSNGKHLKGFGYLQAFTSYGTFYKLGLRNNSAFNAGVNYFSDLQKKRKWYFREFVYSRFVYGFNKNPWETVTLRSEDLYGFNPNGISGNGKMLINIEAVAYAPYNIIGFRFAPVAFMGVGILNSNTKKFTNAQVYQSYSIGLLIRNENLLNSSFEFSVGFYPVVPEGVTSNFKLNPIGSFSLKVRGFDIGKPNTVSFD